MSSIRCFPVRPTAFIRLRFIEKSISLRSKVSKHQVRFIRFPTRPPKKHLHFKPCMFHASSQLSTTFGFFTMKTNEPFMIKLVTLLWKKTNEALIGVRPISSLKLTSITNQCRFHSFIKGTLHYLQHPLWVSSI